MIAQEKYLEERAYNMSHQVHPTVFRLGIVTDWKSRWFSSDKKYKELLEQDVKLRDFLLKKLSKAGVDSIIIERSVNSVNIIIST